MTGFLQIPASFVAKHLPGKSVQNVLQSLTSTMKKIPIYARTVLIYYMDIPSEHITRLMLKCLRMLTQT